MKPTKAEQIIMDYTASTKWSQIKHLKWTTAEVMDVFDTYFKAQNTIHNSDYEATLRIIREFKKVCNGTTLREYCQERINSAKPNCT